MQELFGTDKFDILPHAVALLAAYLLAIPIGWNREKEERSAGLRTFPLVAVAACGFIQAAETMAAGSAEALARVNEGVIVGMGFIGGGAILRLKDSVQGTATAASIWVTGAIGAACGLGVFDVALVLAIMAFATLRLMQPLKKAAGVDDDPESEGGSESRDGPAAARPWRQV
jgi:putative Mg2+ transporter-C (MgtC) family protein